MAISYQLSAISYQLGGVDFGLWLGYGGGLICNASECSRAEEPETDS
jgi:hypothetical protein